MAEKNMKPKIRFKGYTDDWEQRKLGEVVPITMGQSPNGSTYSDTSSDYILVQGNADLKNGWVTPRVWTSQVTKKAEAGDLIMSVRAPAGEMGKTAYNAVIGRGVAAIKGNEFIFQSLVKINGEGYWKKLSCGSTFESLNSDNIKNAEIMIPTLNEQTQIGTFFHNLDNLITLHQRKYDKLIKVKKSMLEKMFPKNGASVPEIRFKGFTGDWEQRKFSELFTTLQNNALSRAELSCKQGVAMNVHYGDVLIKFGECLDVSKEELPFIIDDTCISKYKTSFLNNGDVIIADAAEDETVGKCSEIVGLTTQTVISGLHTIPCRSIKVFASGYLGYYMNSNAYHDQLLPLIQGTKVSSISKAVLNNTILIYPKSKEEQAVISDCFTKSNNLITLNQRKLEKLKNIKKSMLEKMFL